MALHIPHNRLTFDQREVAAAERTAASGYWAGGDAVLAVETSVATLGGMNFAVAVASGVSALRLALLALGVTAEGEVIVPGYSCVAIINAVLAVGAVPIAVDVEHDTLCIDPALAAAAITAKTQAIIAVNTFGYPADIARLALLGMPIIEDCAHGFPLQNVTADIRITSFYATKMIGGGEGGAVLTNTKALYDFVLDWRDYTDKKPHPQRLNDKMSDLEAAVTTVQLQKYQEFVTQRQRLADCYLASFAALPVISLPPATPNRVWYRFVIDLAELPFLEIQSALSDRGITTYPPIEDWSTDLYPLAHTHNAKSAYNQVLSIPLYPTLTDTELAYVVSNLQEVIVSYSNE